MIPRCVEGKLNISTREIKLRVFFFFFFFLIIIILIIFFINAMIRMNFKNHVIL